MHIHRRSVLQLAAGAVSLSAVSRMAAAEPYPARPVRLIVTTPAAGSPDIIGRLIAQWLSVRLGQPFVVENRTGASGNIGIDFIRDTAPVASIATIPLVMEVSPSFPAKTVPEFIAYAKANPGKINMASGGNGARSMSP